MVIRVLRVLRGILDGKGRERLGVKVEVSGMGTKSLSVNCGYVDSAPVLLCNGFELLSELSALFLGFGEYVSQGDAGLPKTITLAD